MIETLIRKNRYARAQSLMITILTCLSIIVSNTSESKADVGTCSCWDGMGGSALCLARNSKIEDTQCAPWCNRPPQGDHTNYKGSRYSYIWENDYNKCQDPQRHSGGVFD